MKKLLTRIIETLRSAGDAAERIVYGVRELAVYLRLRKPHIEAPMFEIEDDLVYLMNNDHNSVDVFPLDSLLCVRFESETHPWDLKLFPVKVYFVSDYQISIRLLLFRNRESLFKIKSLLKRAGGFNRISNSNVFLSGFDRGNDLVFLKRGMVLGLEKYIRFFHPEKRLNYEDGRIYVKHERTWLVLFEPMDWRYSGKPDLFSGWYGRVNSDGDVTIGEFK